MIKKKRAARGETKTTKNGRQNSALHDREHL